VAALLRHLDQQPLRRANKVTQAMDFGEHDVVILKRWVLSLNFNGDAERNQEHMPRIKLALHMFAYFYQQTSALYAPCP
jgi:hypothetical protein